MDLGGAVEEEGGHGRQGVTLIHSPSMPARWSGGSRLCSDAARGTGEDDRAGTGPLSRFGGKARGAGRIPFYIVLLVFQCILIWFFFLTLFSIYSYQLNDLYS